MSHTRVTTLPFLLLMLSPFVVFDSDNPLISCQLCKSKTLWNIFVILCRNVEQDRRPVACKNVNSAFLTFGVIFLCYVSQ